MAGTQPPGSPQDSCGILADESRAFARKSMSPVNRREFMGGLIVSGAVASRAAAANPVCTEGTAHGAASELSQTRGSIGNRTVDFRYAPRHSQSTICFPDDPNKTVVGQAGDLRYGFAKALMVGMEDFAMVVEF